MWVTKKLIMPERADPNELPEAIQERLEFQGAVMDDLTAMRVNDTMADMTGRLVEHFRDFRNSGQVESATEAALAKLKESHPHWFIEDKHGVPLSLADIEDGSRMTSKRRRRKILHELARASWAAEIAGVKVAVGLMQIDMGIAPPEQEVEFLEALFEQD